MNGNLSNTWVENEAELQFAHLLPTGTLTFLFTDVEGSTQLWEQHPEQMRIAMARHDELIELAVRQCAGQIVRPRGEGDSRFAVFPRATDALQAAITIQRDLFDEPWTIPTPRVRIALHSGEAGLRNGDYYGSTVNRCARLRSVAHGGQILLSETTRCLVQDELPTGVSLRDLGEYNLKGLERPEHVFQPVVSDLPADFPPLTTSEWFRNNLPLSLTSFIGRRKDLDELENLLWHSRLLTITGPGGAGKTRLAIQVAQIVQGSFPDGVWFIDLAPLSNTSFLSQHVMNVLGMREEAGYTPDQTLMDALRNKVILLVFDNCEHLLPEAAQLVEILLGGAPRVRILATSREKLDLSGEIVWRIPPLSSPEAIEAPSLENLMEYEAVRLFQDRATAASSDFRITGENAAAVTKICTHLDGNPLAIELAAARVRVLPVEEIEARLDDRFRFLVGSRNAPPRQQTLRALVDWSYDLLNEKERMLLQRLSVFSGSWTLAAAEKICSGADIEDWEVLDLLTGLIDKSFVTGEIRNGRERYHFLETIYKFSRGRLLESNESNRFARQHAEYFLKLTVESYGKEWGPEQTSWLMWLDEESDNLRAALEWLSQSAGDEELLLQMAGSLWRYWEIRGFFTEGRAWLETALAKSSNTRDYWRANGLGGAGHLARQQGDYEQAKILHEQSLALFQELGFKLGIARQLNALGEIAHFQGDYANAIELHTESLSIRHEISDKEGVAVSLRQLGVIARDRGKYNYAEELLEESLKLEHELGDKLFIALSLNDLGLVAHHLSEFERAISLFKEAMSMQRELNDRLSLSNSLQNMANVIKDQGDFVEAELLYKECLALKQELGDKRGISRVTTALSEVAFWQGKYPLAADLAEQGLALSQVLGLKRGVLTCFELLGFISFYQGEFEKAASYAEKSLELAIETEAPQAIGYAKVLLALGKYAQGSLGEAREIFLEAQTKFKEINDGRNMASTYVNLARMAYHLGDHIAARQYLDESLSISQELGVRWNLGFVHEIMGLLLRSGGDYKRSLEHFQESLNLSIEQANQQGIANCLGGLAGLAVISGHAARAARLFGASAKLRREIGAQMSKKDRAEYEHYLAMAHQHLAHAAFEAEWSDGFSMTTRQIIEDLEEWSGYFENSSAPE